MTTLRYWYQPIRWQADAVASAERPRVFCASLADVFEDWNGPILDHKGRPLYLWPEDEITERVFSPADPTERLLRMRDLRAKLSRLINRTPALDWLMLTKRPGNVRAMWLRDQFGVARRRTSISDQASADAMLPLLAGLDDLCRVLFVSAEPLLGPIDLARSLRSCRRPHWLIIGGESGAHARPSRLEWYRSLIGQCRELGIRCFVKQLGSRLDATAEDLGDWPNGWEIAYRVDGRVYARFKKKAGANPDEWIEHLRVRELPDPLVDHASAV